MTVSYQYEVASSTSGGFTRLLFMWRGSLYKLIYRELLLFIAAFGMLSALYRHAFNQDQKRIFEKMVIYCDTFINLIPLSFVLGFYVAYVAGRWWQQYMAIPWPDKIMHSIALYVSGNDDHGRMIRRTLMRYLNLTLILVLRSISSAVKRRFPTLEHVVESGFMTVIELEMYQSVPSVEFNTYWIPCTWFISLLKETKKGSRITDSQGLKIIMEEFNEFRSKCGLLWSYDWVSIPLVYTQVVTIATYSFFLAALVGRQYVDTAKKPLQMEIDIYIPVFTILQFFFFMGLLKVAEQLINPFGDDDEDFELNWLIDRHTKVSYLGVDTLMTRSPPLVKDMYFDQVDLTLPYTEAAVAYKKKTYRGSVHNMQVPEEKHTMFLPEITEEDEDKTPTPKASLSNLHSAGSGATRPATVSAAAAGTWRQHPSTQSLYKGSQVDLEFEGDSSSFQHLEACLGGTNPVPGEHSKKEGETISMTNASRLSPTPKPSRPLSRSESVPVKNPAYNETSCAPVWPSSSTLGLCDTSFQNSEPSIDMHSCHNSTSLLSCGGCGAATGSTNENGGDCPAVGAESLQHYLQKLKSIGQLSDLSLDSYGAQIYNEHFSSASQVEGTAKTLPDERELKHGNCAKVKSCPKLIQVKRQSSSCSNRKKGVRWKPMIHEPSNISEKSQRRLTVDIVPVISQMTGFVSNTEGNVTPETRAVPQLYCKWCNRKLEYPEDIQQESSENPGGSMEHQNQEVENVSNLSLHQEHYSTPQRILNSGINMKLRSKFNTRKAENNREYSPNKNAVLQERRATVSVLNLTGTEFDTKRWQSKPFWEHRFSGGFLRKIKGIKKHAGIQHIFQNTTKTGDINVSYKKPSSQSLPNITLPNIHITGPLPSNLQIPSTISEVVPHVVQLRHTPSKSISDSEDSSVFSSLLEMPVEGSTMIPVSITRTFVEDRNTPEKSTLHLPVSNVQFPSNSNLSASNNSSDVMNVSSPDCSWQSADWTTLLNSDSSQEAPPNIKDSSVGTISVMSELPGERTDIAANTALQEVVVECSENTRPCERWRNQNGS